MTKAVIGAVAALLLATSCSGGDSQTTQATPQASPAETVKPNIIVIIADDLGYADISTYGVQRMSTPNIDRIGKGGVIFTDGYAAAPVCAPSRAGLNTGRYPGRFGFEYNHGPTRRDIAENLGLPVSEITLAAALKEQGYSTSLVGKWHLGQNDDYYPTNRGYDEFVGLLSGATSYMSPDHPDEIFIKVEGSNPVPPPQRAPANKIYEGPKRTVVENEDRYLTEYLGERSVAYIQRSAPSDQPYFLYAAFNAPHDPMQTTKKYWDRFPHIENEGLRVYAAMISALDDQVGAIVDAVEASGESDNTIIYFLSDNGCAGYIQGICACEPLRGGKLSHYEGGTRVPFMMRWPARIEPGQVYRNPVSTMDVFTTSLASAGGELRTDRIYDGVDLAPYLSGEAQGLPHEQLAWRRAPHASLRKGDWKLWKSLDGEFTLLFNLKDDPNESTNLASSEPARLKEMSDAFDQWASELQDPAWPSRDPRDYEVCGTPFDLPI